MRALIKGLTMLWLAVIALSGVIALFLAIPPLLAGRSAAAETGGLDDILVFTCVCAVIVAFVITAWMVFAYFFGRNQKIIDFFARFASPKPIGRPGFPRPTPSAPPRRRSSWKGALFGAFGGAACAGVLSGLWLRNGLPPDTTLSVVVVIVSFFLTGASVLGAMGGAYLAQVINRLSGAPAHAPRTSTPTTAVAGPSPSAASGPAAKTKRSKAK